MTLLCLMRDAAARLPFGVGTRYDICELMRDSQYLIHSATQEKLNSVVSGSVRSIYEGYKSDVWMMYE